MSVLEDAFRIATKGLDVEERGVVGFYLRRRATKLVEQNPGWTVDQLSGALITERAIVSTYVREKTALLVDGGDTKTPKHLDLAVMARIRADGSWATTAREGLLNRFYLPNRRGWISQIVWRAVALHDDSLWRQPMPSHGLETEVLDEIVDRRLRVVEQMTCNVNSGGVMVTTSERTWAVSGHEGPWNDGMLVRAFEYATLPERPFRAHLARMAGWKDMGDGSIRYRPPNGVPLKVSPRSEAAWRPFLDGNTNQVWVRYMRESAVPPVEAIQDLFAVGDTDFLQRNWFFCDYVGSALSLEALWFGRARRDGNSNAFNAVMRSPGPHGEGYVVLGPVVGRNVGLLMADSGDTEFFESVEVDPDELQVGDHVVFWNNLVYDLLAEGAWRNEFSYIIGIDADPVTGRTKRTAAGLRVQVAGHGEPTQFHSEMASELAGQLAPPFDAARATVIAALASDATVARVGNLVKWSPYEPFTHPGAWWLQIPAGIWSQYWGYPTSEAAVKGIPRTVAHDPAAGIGYRPPPDTSAIYFPLWVPKVPPLARSLGAGDSWHAYLQRRKANPSYRAPTNLAELAVDGQLAPGLFYNGSTTKVPVVRPRVRP